MADAHPTRQIPELQGKVDGVVVARVQHPHSFGHVLTQRGVEVVGPQPHAFAKLTEPVLVQRGPQVARVRASVPTLVITNVFHVPSHSRSRGLIASSWRRCLRSSRSDNR